MHDVEITEATPEDAPRLLALVQAAFGARRPVDPPAEALWETVDTIAAQLVTGSGVLVTVDGAPAGCLIIDSGSGAEGGDPPDATVVLRRVSIHPDFQGAGIARDMVFAAEQLAALDGATDVELIAREEFPELVRWWCDSGYRVRRDSPAGLVLGRRLPVVAHAATADAMRALGARLATVLRAGDVIIASGDLGAGKTTLTQGIAAGLGITDPVTSPTFVLSHIHTTGDERPGLVHVDAYRLDSSGELDDLDLEETMASSVTLVEWGLGVAEQLSSDRLFIHIDREADDRVVFLRPEGTRWNDVDLAAALREDA